MCSRGPKGRRGGGGVAPPATEAFVVAFVAILVIDFLLAMLANSLYALLWPTAAARVV
jgi:phospholipid/cholesterol/gamma-HCH transport system permease protein